MTYPHYFADRNTKRFQGLGNTISLANFELNFLNTLYS